MIRIIVDDEQAKAIVDANETVEVRDGKGKLLGVVQPATSRGGFTDNEIDEAKQRMGAPGIRYSTEQVLEHLRSLDAR